MSNRDWLQQGEPHVWRPYCQHRGASPPLQVVGAKGSRLHLADGSKLVDGIASWWTAAHGYGRPEIEARVQAQLASLPHVAFGGIANEAAYLLAAKLSQLLPGELSKVFFVESGSVSVEVALKMALQFFHNRGEARRRVVCFEGGYHGDTFATMALSDPVDGMHRAFRGMGIEAIHLPIPRAGDRFEEALAEVAREVACVIVEPLVQCAGGMRFHDAEALRRMRRACDEHGILLVFDEIATGFYRLGPSFAMEEAGVIPDVVTVGKALTGGTLPLAAAVATEEVFEGFLSDADAAALQHGPTYMGNPLACAAGLASLELFAAQDTRGMVEALEAELRRGLEPQASKRGVREVRVKGAVGVVEMEAGTAPPSNAFVAQGVFVRPLRLASADVVYLMPPLNIEARDLERLLVAVDEVLAP